MVKYISTRNSKEKINSSLAILNGQAADGGLYIPDDLLQIKFDDYHAVTNEDFCEMAKLVWEKFFPDYGQEVIDSLVHKSYSNKFNNEKITPLVKIGSDGYILELFHGPTSAFKDVALSALPNLLIKAKELNNFKDEILILTATSGDTGSAALHGFSDVAGTKIIVFYPDGGVSETQKLQMVTNAGSNTHACAIRGNFDDAQNGVKKLFREIPKPVSGVSLSSANSINIGRLVPQVVYYFAAYKQLVDMNAIHDGDKVNFTVPTGNFGDIMAGYFAMQMGLPINKLICASNKNDVLTEFLKTGCYDRNREFYKTSSPSMDILVSSNLERLLYYVCGEENTIKYMKELTETGKYQITKDELAKIQETFVGLSATDNEGFNIINKMFKENGYLMDTHTSIAWSCYEKYRDSDKTVNVVLSTASPYKFCRSVLMALGEECEQSDEANMVKCSKITNTEIPENLSQVFKSEIIHKDVIETSDMKQYVIDNASK